MRRLMVALGFALLLGMNSAAALPPPMQASPKPPPGAVGGGPTAEAQPKGAEAAPEPARARGKHKEGKKWVLDAGCHWVDEDDPNNLDTYCDCD